MFLEQKDFVDFSDGEDQPETIGNSNNNDKNQQNNNSKPSNNVIKNQHLFEQEEEDELDDLDTKFNQTLKPTQNKQQNLQNNNSKSVPNNNNFKNNSDKNSIQSTLYDNSTQQSQTTKSDVFVNQDIMTNNSSVTSSNNNKLQERIKRQKSKIEERVKQQNQPNLYQQTNKSEMNSNYHDGIDFQKLQTLDQKQGNMYEPGYNDHQEDDLPVLDKANNKFQVKEQPIQFDEDSDDDKQQQQEVKEPVKEEQPEKEIELINDFSSSEEEEEITEEMKKAKENQQKDENEDQENDAAQIQEDDESSEEEEEETEKKEPIAKPIDNLVIPNMREFLTKPLPKGLLLQCAIKRDKSGMNHFHPKYHVYLSQGFKHIMSGKKRSGCKTSNYLIGMDKNKIDKKSPDILGKVRSNFLGTEFHVYDTGENPKEAKNVQQVRKELAVVIYESNLLGAKGPRKMRTLIPGMNKETGEPINWQPIQQEDSMIAKFKSSNFEGMHYYYNKPPKWNEHVQAFVLNFNGRVDKPSVKNFQLVNDQNDEIIYLQFGRVGDDVFNMDLQWPMSPLQAFGICLSSFDYKIACE